MEAYSLGEVNNDSLKECLLFLAQTYPFVDEVAKDAFSAQVNALDSSGSPHTGTDTTVATIATETPAENATETSAEETPAEDTTEAPAAPEGTGAMGTATANETTATEETPAAEPTPDEKIAALEAQLADAKAAASQTPAS